MIDKSLDAFLALLRAGLWEKDVRLSYFNRLDYKIVKCYAEQHHVVGLIMAGIEHIQDIKVPQEIVLQFVGQAVQLEQRNRAMNTFIGGLVEKMRKSDIYTLLVKGQGIAQCYERPLWRVSGDVDFLLSDSNYKKAKEFLLPLSSRNKQEERYSQHLGMSIEPWYVEIHGTLRTGLLGRVDKVVDDVQKDVFYGGNVRFWNNGGTTVFLPAPDNDVFFVFTHFVKHFYKEGMNLRQICDWCRLLWTYRETLNHGLLESWIRKADLMLEWRAFAALAVDYLGMPAEMMPFFDSKFKIQGSKLVEHILRGGPYGKIRDTWAIFKIFPWHTLRFSPAIFFNVNGLKIRERLFGHN